MEHDETTWEEQQDTLDYRQWKAEYEAKLMALHENKSTEHGVDTDEEAEFHAAVADWHAARDAWDEETK